MKARKLTLDDVVVTLEALPEDDGPEGHFASGNDEWDREDVARIRRDMEWNEWAWCCAHVRVYLRGAVERPGYVSQTLKGLHGDDYLGGCDYASAEDFRAGGYYDDMVAEALADLQAKVDAIVEKVAQ